MVGAGGKVSVNRDIEPNIRFSPDYLTPAGSTI